MPINTTETLETLNALNIMASYIGMPPLSNLSDLNNEPDFLLAQEVLNDVRKSVLSQGLPCNTDYDYPLTSTEAVTGHLLLPDGALVCDLRYDNIVERDGKIYNLETREYETRTDLKADIVWNWDYDTLPLIVKQFIAITASRAFVARVKGDTEAMNLSINDERRVKQEFQRYVYAMGDVSVLDGEVPYLISRAGRNHFGTTNRY